VVALTALVFFSFGCGGSGNSGSTAPQAGTYVLNVTASAGAGTTAKTIPLLITITKQATQVLFAARQGPFEGFALLGTSSLAFKSILLSAVERSAR
jgi:hypothetical protein